MDEDVIVFFLIRTANKMIGNFVWKKFLCLHNSVRPERTSYRKTYHLQQRLCCYVKCLPTHSGTKIENMSDFWRKKNWFSFSLKLQIRSCTGDTGYMRTASAASEAISWYVLFGVPKIVEGPLFRGDIIQKLLSDLDLGTPDDLKSDLRGRPRPLEAKIVFLTQFLDFTKIALAPRGGSGRKISQRIWNLHKISEKMAYYTASNSNEVDE